MHINIELDLFMIALSFFVSLFFFFLALSTCMISWYYLLDKHIPTCVHTENAIQHVLIQT